MKRIGLLVLASLLVLNIGVFAQNANKGKRQGRADAPRERVFTPEQRAERLATDLNLTDKQKAEVTEFYKKQGEERAKKRAEFQKNQAKKQAANQADREKFRAEMLKERKAHDAELEKIIGKDKMAELIKIREARQQKMKENRDKRQGTRKGKPAN